MTNLIPLKPDSDILSRWIGLLGRAGEQGIDMTGHSLARKQVALVAAQVAGQGAADEIVSLPPDGIARYFKERPDGKKLLRTIEGKAPPVLLSYLDWQCQRMRGLLGNRAEIRDFRIEALVREIEGSPSPPYPRSSRTIPAILQSLSEAGGFLDLELTKTEAGDVRERLSSLSDDILIFPSLHLMESKEDALSFFLLLKYLRVLPDSLRTKLDPLLEPLEKEESSSAAPAFVRALSNAVFLLTNASHPIHLDPALFAGLENLPPKLLRYLACQGVFSEGILGIAVFLGVVPSGGQTD